MDIGRVLEEIADAALPRDSRQQIPAGIAPRVPDASRCDRIDSLEDPLDTPHGD